MEAWIYRFLNEMGQTLYENAPPEQRRVLDEAFQELLNGVGEVSR